jgi:ubiquitin carboxyl-terminal hydrolase 1
MALRMLPLRGAPFNAIRAGSSNDTTQPSGGLLSSVFSLVDSGSLLGKGVRSFTSAMSGGPSNAPPGLNNISNSCYQNSVIQGLAALPSLCHYLSNITTQHTSFTTDTTNGALHELISRLNNPANQGQNFWIRGKLKSMSTFTQQDAQEYYSKILDELDNEVKKATSSQRRSSVSWIDATKSLSQLPTVGEGAKKLLADRLVETCAAEQTKMIPNPLDGLIAQRVGCTSCGYSEGLSLINFNCITVSLGAHAGYDIRECLDEYTKLEYIDGVECAKCTLLKMQKTLTPLATKNPGSSFETRLHDVTEMLDDEKLDDSTLVKTLNIPKKNWVQSSKSKQIVIARAPKSLVLHVNRSIFDETTGAQYKNTAGVSYPKVLDLGNWCLGTSPSDSREPDLTLESWPRNPTQSMLQDTHESMVPSPFQYRLRAAVTHFGSHGNGHYVCYRPHPQVAPLCEVSPNVDNKKALDEQWWRFSDDNVYAVGEEQAHQANVFMLFYERLDIPGALQTRESQPELVMASITEDAPLPPESLQYDPTYITFNEVAAAVPLPDDDDLYDLILPTSPCIEHGAEPLLQTEHTTSAKSLAAATGLSEHMQGMIGEASSHDTETDMSEAESEDAPSTQLASDSEKEVSSPPTPKPFLRIPPHAMRTAGNAGARGQSDRASLPLVSAT